MDDDGQGSDCDQPGKRRLKRHKSLPAQIEALNEKIAKLRNMQNRQAGALDGMWEAFMRFKKRFDSFYPERHYCPKCKAVVHEQAQACGACGATWGHQVDPRTGLPL